MGRFWGPQTTRYGWALGAALWLGGCAAYGGGQIAPAPAAYVPARPTAPPVAAPPAGNLTLASWYGPGFQGRRTSSGEIFNRDHLTAASRTLPLGSRVRVTNPRNGRSVVVRINDRGPFVRGRGLDLSERAAERIGVAKKGVARVEVQRVDGKTPAASDVNRTRPSGRERVPRYRMADYRRHYAHRRYYRHRPAHHYYEASYTPRPQPPGMVANPVGDWLLGMMR